MAHFFFDIKMCFEGVGAKTNFHLTLEDCNKEKNEGSKSLYMTNSHSNNNKIRKFKHIKV